MTFLRNNALALAVVAVMLALGAMAVRWIAGNRSAPPPRKVMQFTMVNVRPQETPKPAVPPPVVQPPKIVEESRTRVEMKPTDFSPPDMSRPAPGPQGGGRLALAAEGTGAGDAFNLTGNPGGRGLLSGGGLGDGSGEGELGGGAGTNFGWYYSKVAVEIEEVFRKARQLSSASARVELRVWIDGKGRVTRVQQVQPSPDPRVEEAVQSVVGLELTEAPPADIPMPMIARLTARRPR